MAEETTRRTLRRVGAGIVLPVSAIAIGAGGLARPVGFLTLVEGVCYLLATVSVSLDFPTPVDPTE